MLFVNRRKDRFAFHSESIYTLLRHPFSPCHSSSPVRMSSPRTCFVEAPEWVEVEAEASSAHGRIGAHTATPGFGRDAGVECPPSSQQA